MKKLFLFLLPMLMLVGSCSKERLFHQQPFEIRFVVQNEEGTPITEDVSVTYMENGEEKLVEYLRLESWSEIHSIDTFATHWASLHMAKLATSGRANDFYLQCNGYSDTLTLLYEKKGDLDYGTFLLNGKEIKRDMSKL